MDQAMAGGMPMDPSMMGGMPMDPSMMGGMPMDPSMMGGMPGMGAPPAAAALAAGPAAPTAAPAAGPGKGAKIDPGMIYLELGRIRKLLTTLYQNLGWSLPPDILDDQMVAQTAAGQSPSSQPLPADTGAGQPGVTMPAIGQSPAISPMTPADLAKQGGVSDLLCRETSVDGLMRNLEVAAQLLKAGRQGK